MTNRSILLREGYAPTGDRLVTTAFFAAVVHALVIAGISFASDNGNDATPGIEVVLVGEDLPTADNNPEAPYLAQRTQLGSGTTRDKVPARSFQSPADAEQRAGAERARRDGRDRVLTSMAQNMDIAWNGAYGELELSAPEVQALARMKSVSPPGERLDDRTELTGRKRDELWNAADTQASVLAPYVDGWRRKVERLGTLNFPAAARRALASGKTRSPIIEVSLTEDGALQESKIQRSSGSPQLDAAALQILRLASPFDPFPPELADRIRLLRFAYEWRFEGSAPAE
jgi:protein TonB